MRPEFITALYFEGRILLFEKYGDVYEYVPCGRVPSAEWRLLSASPWPIMRPDQAMATIRSIAADCDPAG